MTRVVVDASALAAIAFNEPGADEVARRLEGASVSAPLLLKFELANVAWKKIRRQPRDSRRRGFRLSTFGYRRCHAGREAPSLKGRPTGGRSLAPES